MSKDCGNCGNCSDCFEGVTIPTGRRGEQGVPGPTGSKGDTGNGVVSTTWTSNSGSQPQYTQGTTDFYTITYTNGDTDTIGVYNGADGADGAQGTQGDPGSTGSQGPQGDPGPAGPAGPIGADGAQGEPGSKIFFTDGVPAGGLGVDDDVAYDITTNYPQTDIYQKISSTWQLQGTFGNVVNPGTPTPSDQSWQFKADKTSDQFLDGGTNEMVVFLEDDNTPPTFYDRGEVWSGFDFTADQDVDDIEFAIENMLLENSAGGDITVDVRIEHQVPPAAPTTKVTAAYIVPTVGSINIALLKTAPFDVSAGDKVRIIATPQAGDPGDIKISSGEFYNYTS